MAKLEEKYQLEIDEFGLHIITVRGRCTEDSAFAVETGTTDRYQMVPLPHAEGAVLKTLDGTSPILWIITPPTIGISYTCVKVRGLVNPFAPQQTGGTYAGKKILRYEEVYQEVGGTAS